VFVASVEPQQLSAEGGEEMLEFFAGEALVAADGLAWLQRPTSLSSQPSRP